MHSNYGGLGVAALLLCACASSVTQQAAGSSGSGGSGGSPAMTCPGVDLTNDPLQCGSCGHSCLGGACVAGACQSVRLAHVSAESGGVAVSLALDADHVYAGVNPGDTTKGGLFSIPRTGGDATLLTDETQFIDNIVVASDTLCWNQYTTMLPVVTHGLYSMPSDGSAAPALWSSSAAAVVYDQGFVYATNTDVGNELLRLHVPGGPPEVLGKVAPVRNGIGAIYVVGDTLYVLVATGDGTGPAYVDTFPKDGGDPTLFVGGSPDNSAVHGDYLYVTDACGKDILCRYPLAGGPREIIPIDPPLPQSDWSNSAVFEHFAADDAWVYVVGCTWRIPGECDLTQPNQIDRIPVTGGANHPIAVPTYAELLVMDDKAIVWSDALGDIWQLAK